MADYRIDYINKPDRHCPYERITRAGGPAPGGDRWKDTMSNSVRMTEGKQHHFFTNEGGKIAWVSVCAPAPASNTFGIMPTAFG